ncbi:hypothetical protein MPH_04690 [Macrophomina phaseolina MS6]|uniref:Uncharacterized protein n=1 Tax=Macrophomina phaseolina (strain MS6) TaxID=1126212 RepID=K2SML8_MACPH|nr:hypothetical protein MPH_04690 [Macrophomina phaseolina MS6]
MIRMNSDTSMDLKKAAVVMLTLRNIRSLPGRIEEKYARIIAKGESGLISSYASARKNRLAPNCWAGAEVERHMKLETMAFSALAFLATSVPCSSLPPSIKSRWLRLRSSSPSDLKTFRGIVTDRQLGLTYSRLIRRIYFQEKVHRWTRLERSQ